MTTGLTGFFYVDVHAYTSKTHTWLLDNSAVPWGGYTSSLSSTCGFDRLNFPGQKPTHYTGNGARIFFADLQLLSWFLLTFEQDVSGTNASRRLEQERLNMLPLGAR
jgi:hypothetical protein